MHIDEPPGRPVLVNTSSNTRNAHSNVCVWFWLLVPQMRVQQEVPYLS